MEKLAQKTLTIKPYSLGELTRLYGVSLYVIHKWLDEHKNEIGQPIANTFNVNQVDLIFKKFGVPGRNIILN